MRKIISYSFIMLGIITLTFTACKKDKALTDDITDTAAVDENAQADETFSDVFTSISNFSAESDASFTTNEPKTQLLDLKTLAIASNPTITVLPKGITWPKTVTFDFGTGTTKNDITRKGKIIAVYSKKFKETGAVITITFDNYYVNDTQIEGNKTITNNGKNTAGNYTFSIAVAKSKINDKRGTFTYEATRTLEWTKGENTATIVDDEYAITGTSIGVNSKGISFTTNITSPLIKKIGWPFLVAGIIEIKPSNKTLRVLNYGNGELDAKATLTIGGVSKEIFLRK
ncbi:MAG: hypothetical protein EAY66_05120 [Sphingobacteriales bacterium]|nr:MAG: hypothetical protein EAY66_05120 [Sphingobacteriales bacterium]